MGSLTAAAEARLLAVDLAGAERYLEEKWHAYPVEGGRSQRLAVVAGFALANLYCDEGRWEEAEAVLAVHRREPGGGHVEARLAAHRGRFEEALALARRTVEAKERTDELDRRAARWVVLAEVQPAVGLSAEAGESVERALRLYERKGNAAAIERARATAAT